MKRSAATAWFTAMLIFAGPASAFDYTPVLLSSVANTTFFRALSDGNTFPTGDLTFAGVPFTIPSDGNNIWHASYASGANPRIADIPMNVFSVRTVYTLMGTSWGEREPGTMASIEFFGDEDGYFRYDLDGDVDIRDHVLGYYTTTITGTTSEVWSNGLPVIGTEHLDMQTFTLPSSFTDETLVRIRLTDNGDTDIQRVFLAGLTVQSYSQRIHISVSQVRLCWDTIDAKVYQLQYATALEPDNWQDLGEPVLGTGEPYCVLENVLGERRFYRLRITE